MPNPIKSFSPKARFKVEECRAKVWRRVTKTQRPWRERKMRNLAGSCFALSNLASFPNFITLSTRTKQSLAAQIHTRPDYKICRKDFFWCNRPVAIRWRRVPELRMCESKMTRRNVPDPNWEEIATLVKREGVYAVVARLRQRMHSYNRESRRTRKDECHSGRHQSSSFDLLWPFFFMARHSFKYVTDGLAASWNVYNRLKILSGHNLLHKL